SISGRMTGQSDIRLKVSRLRTLRKTHLRSTNYHRIRLRSCAAAFQTSGLRQRRRTSRPAHSRGHNSYDYRLRAEWCRCPTPLSKKPASNAVYPDPSTPEEPSKPLVG